jgi:parallel beta-helix repeat protein
MGFAEAGMLQVQNVDTGHEYASIQEAIDAPQTLDGHVLHVSPGVYLEHVVIHKALKIMGSGAEATVVDGSGSGTVVHINASNVVFSAFTVRNGGAGDFLQSGIFIDYSKNVTLRSNRVTDCRYGVYVFHSENTKLLNNSISMNYEDGLRLYYSRDSTLHENTIRSNKYNFGVDGQSFAEFNHTIDTSNLVDERPILYRIGLSHEVFDGRTEVSTLYLINANNVTVRDLHLSKNGNGVLLWNATNSKVENITAFDNNYGIVLRKSRGNLVRRNRCFGNWVGLFLEDSDENTVHANSATSNEKGISLYSSGTNNIKGNTLLGNLYGIRLFASSSNRIHHNSLIDNTQQADLVNSHDNDLDDGWEGNFWSDYVGLDLNEDGIGDSAHDWGTGRDLHPLMGRFYEFSVATNQKEFGVSMLCNSIVTGFNSERTGDGDTRIVDFNVASGSESPRFCRISIPVGLLKGPYVAKVYDSSWTELVSRTLPSTNKTHSLIYLKYDSSVSEILIQGIEPNSGKYPVHIVAALAALSAGAAFILYFTAKKRTAKVDNNPQRVK